MKPPPEARKTREVVAQQGRQFDQFMQGVGAFESQVQ